LAIHHLHDGQLANARAEAMRLMELGHEYQDARAEAFSHWLNGWIAFQDFAYDAAMDHAEQCLRTAITAADQMIGLGLKGLLLSMTGRPQEGLRMLRQVHAAALSRGDMHLVAAFDPGLGAALILAGLPQAGLAHLRLAIARRKRDGYAIMESYGHLVMGELHVKLASRHERSAKLLANMRLLDKLVLVQHVVLARWYARVHLRIAARNPRWCGNSAAKIRIEIAQAVLKRPRWLSDAAAQSLVQARQAALEANMPGVSKFADSALEGVRASAGHTQVRAVKSNAV
jgi:hypothetical protein